MLAPVGTTGGRGYNVDLFLNLEIAEAAKVVEVVKLVWAAQLCIFVYTSVASIWFPVLDWSATPARPRLTCQHSSLSCWTILYHLVRSWINTFDAPVEIYNFKQVPASNYIPEWWFMKKHGDASRKRWMIFWFPHCSRGSRGPSGEVHSHLDLQNTERCKL